LKYELPPSINASPLASTSATLFTVASVNSSGTMIHTARGGASLLASSSSVRAGVAPSLASASIAAGATS
jgi:hypothetical protein